ncbi:MAG: F0F1 ATP synthase subunit delta, partial [Petrimonas sp.]|nr:F0F1 ATP synthase subunit delta [Petrimonas sp.]
YRQRHNITDGKLVTAVAIDENTKQRLIGLMEEKLHEDIELEFTTDPKILGGFVLQIDGSQWDASISRQLNQVRNKFKEINKKIGS